jgi:NhaA family Na+:H+ antiporter
MEPRPPPPPVPAIFKAAIALRAFFRLEASSGVLLALCAVAAMVWANSPGSSLYTRLFDTPLPVELAGARVAFTFRELINDGLMTLFFFLVGMEIKRELSVGELRTPARAILPLIAALGGMLVPAGLYLLFNAGTPAAGGWAIPMSTDIAFSIGCLALLRARVSHGLVVFLTALAIFDDIGGIIVIALFYGTGLHGEWLLAAVAVAVVLGECNRSYVRNGMVYAVLGAGLWYAMHHGGIHATLSGVVLGLSIPARPLRQGPEAYSEEFESPLNRFEHLWHGWVAYGIVPLFALANSGISLEGLSLSALAHPVPLGIIVGLFVGKQVGIFVFTLGAVKLGVSPMPGEARASQVHGVAVVAGIGFTVALFVATLAFPGEPRLLAEAKLGILLGSLLSAVVGYMLLRFGPAPKVASAT